MPIMTSISMKMENVAYVHNKKPRVNFFGVFIIFVLNCEYFLFIVGVMGVIDKN